MHIAHLNLQSFKNKIDIVKTHIALSNFDIFTFSESWLDERLNNQMLDINAYNLIRHDRVWFVNDSTQPKRGGGVGMYIKEAYTYSSNTYEAYNLSTNDIECLWIEIIRPSAKNITIGTLYRPPNGNVISFCDKLTETILDININNNKEIYILGDFNINYNLKRSENMRKLHEFELLTNLKQLINTPTRHENIIDLIFTNSLTVSKYGVLDFAISDHELIYCTIKKRENSFQ